PSLFEGMFTTPLADVLLIWEDSCAHYKVKHPSLLKDHPWLTKYQSRIAESITDCSANDMEVVLKTSQQTGHYTFILDVSQDDPIKGTPDSPATIILNPPSNTPLPVDPTRREVTFGGRVEYRNFDRVAHHITVAPG